MEAIKMLSQFKENESIGFTSRMTQQNSSILLVSKYMVSLFLISQIVSCGVLCFTNSAAV